MATIHNLPTELLRPILEHVTTDNHINCNLVLLSVCQIWRWIVARRVYSTVSLYSSSTGEDKPNPLKGYYCDNICTPCLKVSSNYQLAKNNGKLAMVTQLKIYNGLSNENPGLLVNVINVIAGGTNGYLRFEDLRRRYAVYISNKLAGTNLDDALRHDAKVLARHLASMLPNVKSICFDGGPCHVYVSLFHVELVAYYKNQLMSLDCRTSEFFPKPIIAPQLKLVVVSLFKADNPQLLKIDPVPLERLRIMARDLKSCWRIFTEARDGSICFENLRAIYFQYWRLCDWSVNVNQNQHKSEDTLTVTAPKLEHMSINECQFDSKAVEWVAQSPLKSLVFDGHANNALQLCNLLKYPLERFKLTTSISKSASSGEFVQTINQIMSKMQYAKHVACSFEGDACLNLTDLSWPNLTQLNLCAPVDFSELVSKLPKMPALVLLELALEEYYGDDATSAARFLKQLRNIYSEPIQSCIEEFYLIAGDNYDDDENSGLVECFMRAEDDLMWLLPKLKAVYID